MNRGTLIVLGFLALTPYLFGDSGTGLKVRLPGSSEYFKWNSNELLPKGARVFTSSKGAKAKIDADVQVELGQNSVLVVKEVRGNRRVLWLTRGRMRVITEHKKVMVQTPSSEIILTHGKSDIIIANLNTLCIGREGEGLHVKTKLDSKKIPIEHYALTTPQGALIVQEMERDNEFGDDDDDEDDEF